MIWWVVALAVLTILSYLTDLGVTSFMQTLRIPFLNASLLSLLILLCTAGILGRMIFMAKKGEKESLKEKIDDLEKEQQELFTAMADPEYYKTDKARISAMQSRLQEVEAEILDAYERWELLEGLQDS